MAQDLERDFDCVRCGAHAVAVVAAANTRTPFGVLTDVKLGRHDAMVLQHDATSTLGLVRCPVCGQRSPFAVLVSIARIVGCAIGGLFASLLFARVSFIHPAIVLTLIAIFALLGFAYEVRRWLASRRVRFDRIKPGTGLPIAIARVVPPALGEPPPVEPLRTAAPEPIDRADDASGPRFLKP
jgi:transcription elongation factor Elf1